MECVYVCVCGWMVGFFLSTSGDNCRIVFSFSGLIFRLVSLNKTCTKKTLNISKKYELLRHNNGHRWMMHYICSTGSIRKEHRTNKRRGTPLSILTEWILYNSRMKCWKNYWRISKKMFSVSEVKRWAEVRVNLQVESKEDSSSNIRNRFGMNWIGKRNLYIGDKFLGLVLIEMLLKIDREMLYP